MSAVATQDQSPLAPGYKLDRYELLCPIAEGGMASVWVARQRGKHGFEKLVAIKTILPKFASDMRFQQMFLDEARIASRIEHANVAQILDLGEEHDVLYLAMEYVDGDALSKLNKACLKKQVPVPHGIVMRIVADALAGLHEAHTLKDPEGKPLQVVHRDVSPHNILVSSKGVAKLIDFGIAKARDRVGDETNAGVLKGKIQYMAPEQALGRAVDCRADVWACGAILYHLFAGKPPYEGDNQLATLHLLASGRPPLPLPSSVPQAISAIVRKALTHAPENRFESAADMRDALERAMIEAGCPTTTSDVAAFATQHVAERGEKRKQAIDLALAAAAERRRVEELLKPSSDKSATGVTTGTPTIGSAPRLVTNLSGNPPAPPSTEARTVADVPQARPPSYDAFAFPRTGTDYPASSYGTIGSATVESSAQMASVPRSRAPLFALLGAAGAAIVVAAIAGFVMLRPKPQGHPIAGSPMGTTTSIATTPATAGSSGIPTFAATALPKVDSNPAGPAATATTTTTASATATATATSTAPRPPRKKTIDDGF